MLYLLFFYLYELPRCEREADSPSDAAPAPQAHALSVSVGTQKSPELSSSSESEVGSDDQVARPLHKKNSVGFGFGSSERGEDEIRLFGSVALNGDRGATERSPILSKKPETKKEKERVSEEKEQLVASPTSEESLMLPKERTEKQNIGEIEKEEKTTCGGGTGLPRCMIISSVFLLLFSIVLRIFQDSYLKPPNNKQ